MGLTSLTVWWISRTRIERIALVTWSLILLFVCARTLFWPASKTVYPIYSASGVLWWSGIDLYAPLRPESAQGGYRYGPTFAVLCVPFSILSDALGGVTWRLLSVAALIGSLVWFAKRVLPAPLSRDQLAWLILLCVPLSVQSTSNGQVNILVIAAMLAAVAAVEEERWNLASVLIAVTFVCKIYPVALGMLLMALYPRQLVVRMPLAIVLGLLLPFGTQDPGYVLEQYRRWVALLIADDRSQMALDSIYRDLWLLIRLYDIPISRGYYSLIQVLCGVEIALLCWYRQWSGWSNQALLTSTLALASAWMMLLGPSTESCTFILLAPSLSWSIIERVRTNPLHPQAWLLWASVGLFASVVLAASLRSTVGVHAVGVHSWASLLYFLYVLTEQKADVYHAAPRAVPLRAAA